VINDNWSIWNISTVWVTDDARYTRKIKSRNAVRKAAFKQKEEAVFTNKLYLKFKEGTSTVLHLGHSFLWGAGTWTLGEVYRKYLEILQCGAGEGWRRSVGLIMWEMKKYYIELRRRGISCI
jgi:hypothetical protein